MEVAGNGGRVRLALKMERYFNTAGPMKDDLHYVFPPLERWDTEEILSLIDQQKYFVLHAPRQTGKTTAMRALMRHLNHEGNYIAAYANVEPDQSGREDVEGTMPAIFSTMAVDINNTSGDSLLHDRSKEFRDTLPPKTIVKEGLEAWCKASD